MSILVTGSAGFIGYHLTKKLLKNNFKVYGIDNLNSYYDVNLKKDRIRDLKNINKKKFFFYKIDIENFKKLEKVFKKNRIKFVINLAAQAGVRYSLSNPEKYISTNLVGFFNILQLCKNYKVKHLIYASTSRVYGDIHKLPLKENFSAVHPLQLYAATKRSNELLAHSYSNLFNLPTTGLRFFTVYGPWGRPDMALFKFTNSIIQNKKIDIFNFGKHSRDFTYIDDIVEGIYRIITKIPIRKNKLINYNPSESNAPFAIYNIGNSNRVDLMSYIREIEKNLKKVSKKNFMRLQPGDIKNTLSSTKKLYKAVSYKPSTSYKVGIKNFINWYLDYYGKKFK